MNRGYSVAIIGITIGLIVAAGGCSQQNESAEASEPDPAVAAALFQEKCTACHPLGKIEGFDHSEPWAGIVTEMRGKMAKKSIACSDEEAATLVAYLEKTYP